MKTAIIMARAPPAAAPAMTAMGGPLGTGVGSAEVLAAAPVVSAPFGGWVPVPGGVEGLGVLIRLELAIVLELGVGILDDAGGCCWNGAAF